VKRETLLAVGIASVVPLGYYLLVIPARTVRVDSGAAGPFIIGERKDALLSRLPDESYSPQPKPRECPRNWIKVAGMSEVERQCLISADSWIEGISYTRASCPPHVDIQTTLDFKDEKLVSVRQVCRRPE
jgi:hypothetical protein